MKLYVIRHGESLYNALKKWSGWKDVPLTEKGYEDARKAGDILKGISFDKIYSSDLCRAVETAKSAIPGCEPIQTSLLREINLGDLTDKPHSILSKEESLRGAKIGYGEWGGETSEEFAARAEAFLQKMEREETGTVAAFAHGGMLRRMLSLVFGMQIPSASLMCKNCTIAIFEITPEKRSLHSWINID